MMNGKRIILGFLALVTILGLLITSVRGQYGNPYIPLNEYGTPDMSQIQLTPAGHYEQCVAFCVDTPLGSVGVIMQYDLYSDNYGNTWVVPSPMTVLVGAIWPEYIPQGLASRADGWAYGSLAVQVFEAIGGLDALGINVGNVELNGNNAFEIIRSYFDAQLDHWGFMLALGAALAAADADSWEIFGYELWQLSWIYPDNPFDPTDDNQRMTPTPRATRTPRPTATRQPTPTPRPTATPIPTVECPPESISQQPPVAQVLDLYPPNPVVRGQGGQGLDVTFLVVSFPVIHRWWVKEPEWECRWWDAATYGPPAINNGRGCCPQDQQLPGGGCRVNTNDCWWVLRDLRCVERVEAIPDLILPAYLGATANLRQGSIRWIESDLAQKYPGAHVREPYLSAEAMGDPVILADGRCIVEAIAHFDFSDPGYYDITVLAQTAGTQYTPPRSISHVHPTPQPVYLMDTILLR